MDNLITVLETVASRLAKHTEKLKYEDKRENTLDIATLLVAKDTVKFFHAYGVLGKINARQILTDTVARLAAHTALWPNEGDTDVIRDAESFLNFGIDEMR